MQTTMTFMWTVLSVPRFSLLSFQIFVPDQKFYASGQFLQIRRLVCTWYWLEISNRFLGEKANMEVVHFRIGYISW